MTAFSKTAKALLLSALVAAPAGMVSAQQTFESDSSVTVIGQVPSDLTGFEEGPEFEGQITARKGNRIQITTADGTRTIVALSDATSVRSSGGFLGLDKDKLGTDQLLNGLPVDVETVQWGTSLIASKVDLKSKDLKIASMIHNGTAQGFAEQTAATEALRGRVANIDQYNIKGTTNVNFDVGKSNLSPSAKAELCNAAAQAKETDNALLLVVGYTDSTGSQEFNQMLSEKRAARVVNYLQQECDWQPYRMLTPTGMAEADPLADNTTEYGKAQNRRVAVNILVSKAVDDMDNFGG